MHRLSGKGREIAALALGLAVFAVDRLSKHVALANLSEGSTVPVIPGVFHITLVFNKAAAFGLFAGQRLPFMFISILVLLLIIAYIYKERKSGPRFPVALGLILGGASGNLIDRAGFGHVIDFFDFRIWPVFNVADSAITIGAALLIWRILLARKAS